MESWFDKAVEELENDLEAGLISQEEFRREMRELNAEFQNARFEAAQEAYDEYY